MGIHQIVGTSLFEAKKKYSYLSALYNQHLRYAWLMN